MPSQAEANAMNLPPSDDELGRAVLAGARLAVNKDFVGAYPPGMDRDALVSVVVERALPKCRKWRAGGPKTLADYCYLSCRHALTDWARHRQVVARNEHAKVDVLDCVTTIPLKDAPGLVEMEDSREGY